MFVCECEAVEYPPPPPRNGNRKNAYLQLLRGCAITAVVIIHTLPESTATIVVRPFLNWGVALFLFLSGLLTPRSKVGNLKIFYGRRIQKSSSPTLCGPPPIC